MSNDNPKNFPNPDNLPVVPPLPKPVPLPSDGAVAICGECGIRIPRVWGYYCGNQRCPVQPKVTC